MQLCIWRMFNSNLHDALLGMICIKSRESKRCIHRRSEPGFAPASYKLSYRMVSSLGYLADPVVNHFASGAFVSPSISAASPLVFIDTWWLTHQYNEKVTLARQVHVKSLHLQKILMEFLAGKPSQTSPRISIQQRQLKIRLHYVERRVWAW